ncbi:LysR family transcriptional regulator [Sinomonas sp. P10A9]|uniref:LysR family transcriptional regulator n=1 Tax=Sinomonas puerhi TaxID=3238584 RepID=A0AB39KZE2_9MICC
MFSLDQLRCFVAVAEELHFGRAAERLHMTQPPLSRQIQRLEAAIGAELLERNNRSVKLTPAGETTLVQARALLAHAEALPTAARRAAAGLTGTVRLGFTATAALNVVDFALATVEREVPGVHLSLREMVSSEQIEALEHGELDLALLRPPVDLPGYESFAVHREALVLAAPADGPFGAGGTVGGSAHDGAPVALSALANAHLLMYSPTSAAYFHNLASGLVGNVALDSVQYITQIPSMVALVDAGRGVALVPESASSLHFRNVVFRPLEGVAPDVVELHACWRTIAETPALRRVVRVLREGPFR